MTRRRRDLAPEERRLWEQVARHVTPLPGHALPEPEAPVETPVAPTPAPAETDPLRHAEEGRGAARLDARTAVMRASRRGSAAPRHDEAGRLASGLERRTARALARGRLAADAVLDLHGLTQADAHRRLLLFLRDSQARGHRLVQVVTGKGRPEPGPAIEGRGVLRRVVPHWLQLPQLRLVVLGFEEAAPHRGGGGALYVRLRRGPLA